MLRQPIETLSKGFKRRVGLAQALLHDPPALILDEPTDGLDPNQKHEMRALIQEIGHDKAIVISTHILEEVDAVCTRAAVIAGGRLLADATPEALAARSPLHNAVSVTLAAASADEAATALAGRATAWPGSSGIPPARARRVLLASPFATASRSSPMSACWRRRTAGRSASSGWRPARWTTPSGA